MKITRIVRLEFKPEYVDVFLNIFHETRAEIRAMPGCSYLELSRDSRFPTVFYTTSHWDSEADLDAYRNSALFGRVWPRTKVLFQSPPQAFSMISIIKSDEA